VAGAEDPAVDALPRRPPELGGAPGAPTTSVNAVDDEARLPWEDDADDEPDDMISNCDVDSECLEMGVASSAAMRGCVSGLGGAVFACWLQRDKYKVKHICTTCPQLELVTHFLLLTTHGGPSRAIHLMNQPFVHNTATHTLTW
jgi:hypothetical protein